MTSTQLSKALTYLMKKNHIRTSELSRKVCLPQPTLHRMVVGITPNPHISSLQRIANYFNVTVDQLRGRQPIPGLTSIDSSNDHENDFKEIPFYAWPDFIESEQSDLKSQKSIITTLEISTKAFATDMPDHSMAPAIPYQATLIIDPSHQAKDHDYVLVKIANSETPVLRQLVIDGDQQYLKASHAHLASLPLTTFDGDDTYLGKVLQVRIDLI